MKLFLPLLFSLATLAVATDFQLNLADYAFIDTTINEIQFPRGDSSYNLFYKKMDSLVFENKGQVRIIHFGGSHIQADVFSNRVRENLVKRYPGLAAGRGFVFPYSAARTNTPSSYASYYKGKWDMSKNVLKEITKPLGLLGIAVSTIDPQAEVSIFLNQYNSTPIWFFNRIRILGYSDLKDVEPVIIMDSNTYRGKLDSVNQSYLFDLPRSTDSLIVSFKWKDTLKQDSLIRLIKIDSLNKDTAKQKLTQVELVAADSMFQDTLILTDSLQGDAHKFTLTGIIVENEHPGISYTNVGINGAKVQAYLVCPNLQRDLSFFKPDLIIFSIGINDAHVEFFNDQKFQDDYDSLITVVKTIAPDAAILFTTNNDAFRKGKRKNYIQHPNGEIARKAFFKMAKKYEAGVWDLFSIMGGLGSMAKWEKADLAKKDKVHFKSSGYKLLGDLFYDALLKTYNNHIAYLPAEIPVVKTPPPAEKTPTQKPMLKKPTFEKQTEKTKP